MPRQPLRRGPVSAFMSLKTLVRTAARRVLRKSVWLAARADDETLVGVSLGNRFITPNLIPVLAGKPAGRVGALSALKAQKKGTYMFHTQYESKSLFAGQRASVGRAVTIKVDAGIRSGAIDGISDDDEISIHSPGDATPRRGLLFVATKTPADVLSMPSASWTWPPKSSP